MMEKVKCMWCGESGEVVNWCLVIEESVTPQEKLMIDNQIEQEVNVLSDSDIIAIKVEQMKHVNKEDLTPKQD